MVSEKMAAGNIENQVVGRFPSGTSPYTLAIAKCLDTCSWDAAQPDPDSFHALMNLVQGRMLEYLADRICREFDIRDSVLRGRMVSVLLGIFSDEFFAVFRRKVRVEPELVLQIARRIIRKEGQPPPARLFPPNRESSDALYPAIFRMYFDYRDLDALLDIVESDGEIQKIVLGSLLKTHLGERPVFRHIMTLLEEDSEGVTSSLFMGYIKMEGLDTLVRKVESDEWRQEYNRLYARLDHLRGD